MNNEEIRLKPVEEEPKDKEKKEPIKETPIEKEPEKILLPEMLPLNEKECQYLLPQFDGLIANWYAANAVRKDIASEIPRNATYYVQQILELLKAFHIVEF